MLASNYSHVLCFYHLMYKESSLKKATATALGRAHIWSHLICDRITSPWAYLLCVTSVLRTHFSHKGNSCSAFLSKCCWSLPCNITLEGFTAWAAKTQLIKLFSSVWRAGTLKRIQQGKGCTGPSWWEGRGRKVAPRKRVKELKTRTQVHVHRSTVHNGQRWKEPKCPPVDEEINCCTSIRWNTIQQ